jgi:hypothetical protein
MTENKIAIFQGKHIRKVLHKKSDNRTRCNCRLEFTFVLGIVREKGKKDSPAPGINNIDKNPKKGKNELPSGAKIIRD